MKYKVEYWKRISFNEKDVFWEEVEANSEEEAIQYINDNIRWVIPKHTKVMKLEDVKNKIDAFFDSKTEEEFKKYKKYSGRDCDVVLPWGETLKEFYNKMSPNEEIYFYIDQERGYSEYLMVEDDVRFKHPETGEWIEAVFYENETGKYVREKEDFYNKFEKLC